MAVFRAAQRVASLPPGFFGEMDRRIAQARARGVDVIDLSKGNPDLPTPPAIVRAMQRAVADPVHHRYPAATPLPSLARAIAAAYARDHGVTVDPEAEVAAFHGSHEALLAAFQGLVDPGATVVLPDPGYPAYRSLAALAGAGIAELRLDPARGYRLDARGFAGADEAALVVLNSPHNPTGALVDAAEVGEVLALAERLGAALVHDFAYSSLGFSGRPLSALAVDASGERTVEISTLSKTYSMAGWRLGFAAGNASLIAAMRRYQSHALSTIFGATQEAAAAALSGDQDAAEALVEVYRARRDAVVAALRESGWRVEAPGGTFFVWLAVPGDDGAFAARLLEEHGVAVAPGSGFGPGGAGHVRIGLVHDEATLRAAIARFPAPEASA